MCVGPAGQQDGSHGTCMGCLLAGVPCASAAQGAGVMRSGLAGDLGQPKPSHCGSGPSGSFPSPVLRARAWQGHCHVWGHWGPSTPSSSFHPHSITYGCVTDVYLVTHGGGAEPGLRGGSRG